MKKFAKIFFAIAITVITCISTSVSALEYSDGNVGFSTTKPNYSNSGGIVPYGDSVPKSAWSWSKGDYPMEGSTSYNVLYSNYYFTGMTTLNFTFTKADESFEIEVWEIDGGAFWFDKKIDTITIKRLTADDIKNGKTSTGKVSGLTATKHYYTKVLPPAHFKGTVTP